MVERMDPSAVIIRPLTRSDVSAAQQTTIRALDDLTTRTADRMYGELPRQTPVQLANSQVRYSHFIETDPGGAWVADAEGEIVGVAISMIRESLWCLSLLMVDPLWQGNRIGSRLLQAALDYRRDCADGIINASSDTRALHAYLAAGFRLQPAMGAYGTLDRRLLPTVTATRDGSMDDIELCTEVDRHVRGAGRSVDVPVMLSMGNRLIITEMPSGRGYVMAKEGAVTLLAATTDEAAQRLLWSALATAPTDGRIMIGNVTAAQQWAFDVIVGARLSFSHSAGGVLLRGNPGTMRPYLPSGIFL